MFIVKFIYLEFTLSHDYTRRGIKIAWRTFPLTNDAAPNFPPLILHVFIFSDIIFRFCLHHRSRRASQDGGRVTKENFPWMRYVYATHNTPTRSCRRFFAHFCHRFRTVLSNCAQNVCLAEIWNCLTSFSALMWWTKEAKKIYVYIDVS